MIYKQSCRVWQEISGFRHSSLCTSVMSNKTSSSYTQFQCTFKNIVFLKKRRLKHGHYWNNLFIITCTVELLMLTLTDWAPREKGKKRFNDELLNKWRVICVDLPLMILLIFLIFFLQYLCWIFCVILGCINCIWDLKLLDIYSLYSPLSQACRAYKKTKCNIQVFDFTIIYCSKVWVQKSLMLTQAELIWSKIQQKVILNIITI